MPSRLSIYQGALRLLGPHQLASLSENRPERHKLDEVWDDGVRFLLSKGLWNFAIRSVELGYDENYEPLWGYSYAFSQPDDFVRIANISDDPTFSREFEQFENEKGYFFADVEPLYLRYVSNDEAYGFNVEAYSPAFALALSAHLAFESGLPISGDKSNRNDMLAVFKERLKEAKTLDAIDERVKRQPQGRWSRARLVQRNGRDSC